MKEELKKELKELAKDFQVSVCVDKDGNPVAIDLWAKEIFVTSMDDYEERKIANKSW